MIQTMFIISILIVISVFVAVIYNTFFNDKHEPNYYDPKKNDEEMKVSKDRIEELKQQAEDIKNEKNNDANSVSDSLNKLDI